MKRIGLGVLISAALLLSAACGSDSKTSTATTTANSSASTESTASDAGTVFEILVIGARVEGGIKRVNVELGTKVTIKITCDADEELHVHGYDQKLELVAATQGQLTFVADIPGVFEVELEQSGLQVAELHVA